MVKRVITVTPSGGRTGMSIHPSAGLARLTDSEFLAVIKAVRYETEAVRAAIHRLRHVPACDLRLRAVTPGTRLVVAGECLCRDFLLDMIVEADHFLASPRSDVLHNPPGAVRVHVRRRAVEWTRRRRAEIGAQARTDRLRGSLRGRAMPDEYHRALFQFVAEEAGSLAPLGSEHALHRRLAELLAREFGGPAADHLPRVADALAVVEGICREGRKVVSGPGSSELVTWWERYVEIPLGRRQSLDEVSVDAEGPEWFERRTPFGGDPDPDEAIVAAVLQMAAAKVGVELATALVAVVDELVRQELLSATAARSFVEDTNRVSEAAEQVRLLLAA